MPADVVHADCYGVGVSIRTDEAGLAADVALCLPPGSVRRRAAPRPTLEYTVRARELYELRARSRVVLRSAHLADLLEGLEGDLALNVAARATPWLFVHAGVVEWRGRAIVLPGRSFAGKSTLVEALVRLGGTYYSDEYAVFDSRGEVHPFPRPLALRAGGGAGGRRVRAEAIGSRSAASPAPVGLVAAVRFREGAAWKPAGMSPGQAVLALFANTVAARSRGAEALRILRRAVESSLLVTGLRGEAGEMAWQLLEAAAASAGCQDAPFTANAGWFAPPRRKERR